MHRTPLISLLSRKADDLLNGFSEQPLLISSFSSTGFDMIGFVRGLRGPRSSRNGSSTCVEGHWERSGLIVAWHVSRDRLTSPSRLTQSGIQLGARRLLGGSPSSALSAGSPPK